MHHCSVDVMPTYCAAVNIIIEWFINLLLFYTISLYNSKLKFLTNNSISIFKKDVLKFP